jgi:hypothetical protein
MSADVSGQFGFTGVAPGAYRVFAWTELPEGLAEQSEDFVTLLESLGQPVTVNSGGTSTVRIRVIAEREAK